MYVVGGSGENKMSSWVGMYINDNERILEKVVNLVGDNPTQVFVQIMYLDRILSFSRKKFIILKFYSSCLFFNNGLTCFERLSKRWRRMEPNGNRVSRLSKLSNHRNVTVQQDSTTTTTTRKF